MAAHSQEVEFIIGLPGGLGGANSTITSSANDELEESNILNNSRTVLQKNKRIVGVINI
jgi:hypothetical protein